MNTRKVIIVAAPIIVVIFAAILLVSSVVNLQILDKQQQILHDKLYALQIINDTMHDGAITPSQAEELLTKLEHPNGNSSSIMSRIQTIKAQQSSTPTPAKEKEDFRCVKGPMNGFIPTDDEGNGYWASIYQEIEQSECDRDTTGQMYLRPYRMDILRADADIDGNTLEEYYTEYRLLNGTILAFGEKTVS